MGYAHDYAAAIMRRGRVAMPPADFVPDWADSPRRTKLYPGADTVPLPDGGYPADASLDRGLGPATGTGVPGGAFDLGALAGMLLDSYGLTGRRLGVQANTDLPALPRYPDANWSRGTASGGGLYPVSVYWVSGPGGPLPPGVHYYATRRHALQRLLAGDVSGEVRAALGEAAPGAADTDQYLVLGVKYWQNAFKYNSFSFHAVSMDVGTLLQTWRMWARARGLDVEPLMWFDEERLARLLGLRTEEEGVFAVVPLRWDTASVAPAPAAGVPSAPAPAGPGSVAGTAAAPAPAAPAPSAPAPAAVRRRDAERSRTVLAFDAVTRMQAATAEHAARRPAPGALAPAAAPPAPGGPATALPAPRPLGTDVRTALRRRRSSFGRFEAARPVGRDQLAACLKAAEAAARLGGDTGTDDTRLVGLYAFANHVEGLPPGAYAHDPAAHGLRPVTEGRPGAFLQRNYFLANYNLEQAGAVLVPAVRTTAVLDAVGDRGYRVVNAAVGAVSQAVYTASSAMGLGCGVALGFDNIAYIEELGLEGTGEAPLLIMMIGHERPAPADYRYEIA